MSQNPEASCPMKHASMFRYRWKCASYRLVKPDLYATKSRLALQGVFAASVAKGLTPYL